MLALRLRHHSSLLLVGFLLALPGCNTYFNASGKNQEKATAEARAWAEQAGLDPSRVSCKKHDSDGDGDITCTAVAADGQTITLECMGEKVFDFLEDEGCREVERVTFKGRVPPNSP